MKTKDKTKKFYVTLKSLDPTGISVKEEQLTMDVIDDPNSMIHERLFIEIGNCVYRIDINNNIIDKLV